MAVGWFLQWSLLVPHPGLLVSFHQLSFYRCALLLRAGTCHLHRTAPWAWAPSCPCEELKKMPRFWFPHAHPRVGCSQWLMGVEVQKPNSCFSRCNLHFPAPHRIRLSLGVQLKSLVLGFFLFPILLLQFPYWLILRVLPLINHLDPNVAQGLVWEETKLRQLCCFLSPEYQSPSCLHRATLRGGDETRERLLSQPWA